jgi:CheY-like chemotaxis protein
MKILLVDDHEGWLNRVQMVLEGGGHELTACSSVEAALAAYRRDRPDLIITDLEMWPMPGGDGDQLIRAVRALEDEGAPRTRIHLLSGAFVAPKRWQEFGADGFTDKNPFLYSQQPIQTLLDIPAMYDAV